MVAGPSRGMVPSMFLLFLVICGYHGVNSLFLRALPAVRSYLTTNSTPRGQVDPLKLQPGKLLITRLSPVAVTGTETDRYHASGSVCYARN